MTVLRALERFTHRSVPRAAAGEERCEICAAPLIAKHPHLVDLHQRGLRCACDTCARLFVQPGAAGGRYRTVPDRVLYDPALVLTDAAWSALGVPVHLAFVFYSSAPQRWVICYPSPAGATESDVSDAAWASFAKLTPLVASVERDVEALLVHGRRGETQLECMLVPIAACYELVGGIRRTWKGLDGGDRVRDVIEQALAALRARRKPLRARPGGAPT